MSRTSVHQTVFNYCANTISLKPRDFDFSRFGEKESRALAARVDNHQYTLLHHAAESIDARLPLFQWLVENQSNPAAKNDRGETPLHLLLKCHNGRKDVIQYLFGRSPSRLLNEVDRKGNTVLHVCATTGFSTLFIKLMDAGANPSTRNNDNMTPVHLLVMSWAIKHKQARGRKRRQSLSVPVVVAKVATPPTENFDRVPALKMMPLPLRAPRPPPLPMRVARLPLPPNTTSSAAPVSAAPPPPPPPPPPHSNVMKNGVVSSSVAPPPSPQAIVDDDRTENGSTSSVLICPLSAIKAEDLTSVTLRQVANDDDSPAAETYDETDIGKIMATAMLQRRSSAKLSTNKHNSDDEEEDDDDEWGDISMQEDGADTGAE